MMPSCDAQQLQRVDYVYRPLGNNRAAPSGNPFAGILPGLALMMGSSALLWWNEGRTARTEHLLSSAHRNVLSVGDGDDESLLEKAASTGHLVHLTSPIASASGVSDDLFPEVGGKDALRLQRTTEAYQWEEVKHVSEKRVSDNHVERRTTYSYKPRWSTHRVSSTGFEDRRYHNPHPRLPPGSVDAYAMDAKLTSSGLAVPPELLAQLGGWDAVDLPPIKPRDDGVVAPVPDKGRSSRGIYFAAAGQPTFEERGDLRLQREQPQQAPRLSLSGEAAPRVDVSSDVGRYLDEERDAGGGYSSEDKRRRAYGGMADLAVPPTPVVGDARVSFRAVHAPPEGVSVLGGLHSSSSSSGGGGGGAGRGRKPSLKPWSAARDGSKRRGLFGFGRDDDDDDALDDWDEGKQPMLFMLVRGRAHAGSCQG